ncbi:ATP-dependent helicase, partial [Candidatus Uhrbacteria bacterium]|nr:ATP-dependent helicase [Candidatus Uhrbacteria bacterium]
DQFQYILVDEYQDTNPVQAALVTLLAVKHRNILVVGDDAQSIYSFRAADIRNILDFPRQFPEAKTFRLETNYRSPPEILDLANEIISKNQAQFPKTLKAVKAPHRRPRLVSAASAAEQAAFIVETILQLRDEGMKLDEMAVLFRATHHSQALEFELSRRDLPYEYRGGMKFFERSHIKDVLAFLRLAANPADQLAWIRVLSLQEGIGSVMAGRLAERLGQAETLEQAISSPVHELLTDRAQRGWREMRDFLERLNGAKESSASISLVTKSQIYQEYLEAEFPNWQERLEDLEQLAAFAERTPDIAAFLGEVSLFDDYGRARAPGASQDHERVILSTIHQAKGLEWDTVFVMHLTADDFPNRRALLEEGGLEEERRLFYVATTRASRQLFLVHPITSGYDSLAIVQPSPFLEELRSDLLETREIDLPDEELMIRRDAEGNENSRRSYLREVSEM